MFTEISQDDLRTLLASGPKRAHFVGIAGSGMRGLARLYAQRGHHVSGSDLAPESSSESIQELNVKRFYTHDPANVEGADFVCFSSAIAHDNTELLEAQRRGIPVVRRARALAALIAPQKAIVISGTHGKTTTTSMIAFILEKNGMDPSFYIGAAVPNLTTSAKMGRGEYFVIEADESDGSMSEFKPHDLVILNIEAEHLDFYKGIKEIEKSFKDLANSTTGNVIYCADDPVALHVGSSIKNSIGYSIPKKGKNFQSWWAEDIETEKAKTHFEVMLGKESKGHVTLSIPGKHNVSNSLAAIAATTRLGVDFKSAAATLEKFSGAERRFEVLFNGNDILLINDYAHHPSEIRATLDAARQKGFKRILAVFQPHRYTRVKALHRDFGPAFEFADKVFLTDIYAASETPIEGVTGQLIADAVKGDAVYEPNLWRLKEKVGMEIKKGDLVLVMGAGNICEVSHALAAELQIYSDLRKLLAPKTLIHRYEPVSKHTTMRVGGFAKLWVEPMTEEDLAKILAYCDKERKKASGNPLKERLFKVTLIGRGSNLLVRDPGISGVTIHLAAESFRQVDIKDETIVAGSGVKLKAMVMAAKKACLTGLEFLEGIPGTLGGALWMNAGAMGNNIFDVVEKVRYMDFDGTIHEKKSSELNVKYRSCEGLHGRIALSATFKTRRGDSAEIAGKLRQFEEKRWASQPAEPSAGCIFKNPPNNSAGKIIDELGLKGLSFGHARVSDVHANFIVNDGGATANDIINLIAIIKERVKKERGIDLETEVVMIGDERW